VGFVFYELTAFWLKRHTSEFLSCCSRKKPVIKTSEIIESQIEDCNWSSDFVGGRVKENRKGGLNLYSASTFGIRRHFNRVQRCESIIVPFDSVQSFGAQSK
jgi:hypothetical protein